MNPPAESSLFEVRSLAVEAGGRCLLSDLDFRISRGEGLALSGPSGIGKSSLLRVLAALDPIVSGRIELHGSSPADHGIVRYRRRVNLLFQKPLLFEMSLRENLALAFGYSCCERSFPEERAAELLGRLGLADKSQDADPRTFSVGEQQRVCLARSLLIEPEMLLLDEPTSALDPESAGFVESLIREERERRNLAFILVAHDREQARRLGARTLSLKDHRHRKPAP